MPKIYPHSSPDTGSICLLVESGAHANAHRSGWTRWWLIHSERVRESNVTTLGRAGCVGHACRPAGRLPSSARECCFSEDPSTRPCRRRHGCRRARGRSGGPRRGRENRSGGGAFRALALSGHRRASGPGRARERAASRRRLLPPVGPGRSHALSGTGSATDTLPFTPAQPTCCSGLWSSSISRPPCA